MGLRVKYYKYYRKIIGDYLTHKNDYEYCEVGFSTVICYLLFRQKYILFVSYQVLIYSLFEHSSTARHPTYNENR